MLLLTNGISTRWHLRAAIVTVAALVASPDYGGGGAAYAALLPCDDPAHAAQVLCPTCESTGTCTISGVWDVPNAPLIGCVIDFDNCSVVVTGTLRSDSTDGGKFSLFAGDLTLRGGKLCATGNNGGEGGRITASPQLPPTSCFGILYRDGAPAFL